MAGDIKQKIVLAGEKEYSAALKEANRNLRVLRSELKAETAELGRNATEQQKAEVRAKNLRQQIAEQEKIVKAAEKALEEVRKEYGDNEEMLAQYETRLNSARTALANMRNDLEGTQDSLQKVGQAGSRSATEMNSIAESMQRIGSVGDTVSGAIEGIFTGMIDAVKDTISELWAMISETAARANNWVDVAGYWNTDPQKIQQWNRAVNAAAKDFGDLESAVSKIVLGDHDKIFDLTGVSWSGDIDEWQYAMDVLNTISTMSHEQRGDALTSIFGEKKATKIMNILQGWGDITSRLEEFNGNETGYGMSDEELETMSNLWVQIATIEEKWNALKDNVAAGLGFAAMGLTLSVEGALDGVADFLSAKNESEREAALAKIRTNIEDFFRKLGQIITEAMAVMKEVGTELSSSEDPMTKLVGEIILGVQGALEWLTTHQEEVVTAFKAIFGVWLLGRLASIAGRLASIVASIEAVKLFNIGSAAASATSGAAAAGASAGTAWMTSFAAAAAKAVPALAFIIGVATPADTATNDLDMLFDENGNPTTAGREAGLTAPKSYYEEHGVQVVDAGTLIGAEPSPEVVEREEQKKEAGAVTDAMEAFQQWWDAYRTGDDNEGIWWDRAKELLGDENGLYSQVAEYLLDRLDEDEWNTNREDLPPEWFLNSDQWQNGNSTPEGVTSGDLQNFRSLPGEMVRAVKEGAANGVSGIRVFMDGTVVGRLVAPTVSRYIAAEV